MKKYKSLSTELSAIKRMATKGSLEPILKSATKEDLAFSHQLFNELTEFSIDSHLDILYILQHYKDFVGKYLEENTHLKHRKELAYIDPIVLKPGVQLIYGPPDSLRSTVSMNIARLATLDGLQVVYVDAENHYIGKGHKLLESCYYVPGTYDTHRIVAKLLKENLCDLLVIDTIFALTRWQEVVKTMIKTTKISGQYILLVDQERADVVNERFVPIPATYNTTGSIVNGMYRLDVVEVDEHTYKTRCRGKTICVDKATMMVYTCNSGKED